MPDYTGNLNLAKPIPNEDSADIRVINENMDKKDDWSTELNKKTKGATSEAAGIVKYGTDVSTALEGSKLAEILGIEYGGVLNNNNQKVAGKGYYDTANKKIYKCTTNTTINYADAGYFIEVSNNDLLGKLQNLSRIISLPTINYKGVIINVSHNENTAWFSFEGSVNSSINSGTEVIYRLPSNIKPLTSSEPTSKYLTANKSLSIRVNTSGEVYMYVADVLTGSSTGAVPIGNVREYCCIPVNISSGA